MHKTFTGAIPHALLFKVIMIKTLVLLLLILCWEARADVHAQHLTLSHRHTELGDVLQDVREQSGYSVFYDANYLKMARPVTVELADATLEQSLAAIFADQPFTYSIENRVIVIRSKPTARTRSVNNMPPEAPVREGSNLVLAYPIVTGRVTDSLGRPLAGASVRVLNAEGKRTALQTKSDHDGYFELKNVPEEAGLEVSYIGYVPKVLKANPEMGTIAMKAMESELEEVEVMVNTGYQTIPKERATGSFSFLDSTAINRRISMNLLDRLDGMTSGLLFKSNSFSPFDEGNIQVRGRASLSTTIPPLIIVDNFPYDGDLANLNPADIASISVLKDAAAASVWGARAGNGVIVVVTKKGQLNAKAKVDMTANLTIGQKPDLYYEPQLPNGVMLEVQQFLYQQGAYTSTINSQYRALPPAVEVLLSRSQGRISSADSLALMRDLESRDVRRDLSEYYYRNPVLQQYQANIRGGGAHQKYYLSAGYDRNLTNIQSDKNNRITLNGNNSYYLLDDRLEIGTNIVFTTSNSVRRQDNFENSVGPMDELADERGNPLAIDRHLRRAYVDTVGGGKLLDWSYKPLEDFRNGYNMPEVRLTDYRVNTYANLKVTPWLSGALLYTFQKGISERTHHREFASYYMRDLINSFSSIDPITGELSYGVPLGAMLTKQISQYLSHNARVQVNFQKRWGRHEINGLGGAELKDYNSNGQMASWYGYDPETAVDQNAAIDFTRLYNNFNSGLSMRIPTSSGLSGTTDRFVSFFGNVAYSFANRYTLSASARRDESNLFGVKTNQKGVPLWSGGISWSIAKEPFYRSSLLPQLKLRATFGYMGNVDKSLSAFLTARAMGVNTYNAMQAYILNPPNPSLRWEKVESINIGLDFGFKDGVVSGTVDIWQKDGLDLIGQSPIASQTGLTVFKGNSASVRSRGIDLVINSQNTRGALKWNSSFMYNLAVDRVTDYAVESGTNLNLAVSQFGNTMEGYPYSAAFSIHYAGLDASGDPLGYLNGEVSNDWAAIANSMNRDDLVFHGSSIPTSFGNLLNTLTWKDLSLSFNITYKFGFYFRRPSLDNDRLYTLGNAGGKGQMDYQNRWQQPGDEYHTSVPALKYPTGSYYRNSIYLNSNVLVESGNHIRLQDIRLDYRLPKHFSVGLSELAIYTYINNVGILWKATDYHFDPYSVHSPPIATSFAFGIKAGI